MSSTSMIHAIKLQQKFIGCIAYMCGFSSCKYFYGEKKVIKVTKIGGIITYDFNYGQQIFSIGDDTLLQVGSWEDDNGMWHTTK
jgi:hypothetical protein